MEQVYDTADRRFEALKLGYQNQVDYLRLLTNIDLKLFFGFMTVQLALAGWLAKGSESIEETRLGIFLIVFFLALVAVVMLVMTDLKRKRVIGHLKNYCDALGFTKSGKYLDGSPLEAEPGSKSWLWVYILAIAGSFLSLGMALWSIG